CEDQAAVALDAGRGDQAPVGPVQLFVVNLLVTRDADEAAFEVISPAVVLAHEGVGVTFVGLADGVATVAAGVDEDVVLALLVFRDDDGIAANPGLEITA